MKYAAIIAILAVIGFSREADAQLTAREGLGQIKSNLENSRENLTSYKKNLQVVDGNVQEVAKARQQLDSQRGTLAKAVQENNQQMATYSRQENEVMLLIKEEQTKLTQEQAKIDELMKIVNQLKDNQKKRESNIQSYKSQMNQAALEKKEWQERGEEIKRAHAELQGRNQSLVSQETEWRGKRKGYEGEVVRWQKEVERNQKLQETYSSLADVKE